ncbi:hypothetical protein, partial [Microvirga aerophila]|uniref:hypothetical protein n=1 Tax=Microvirga aerophila TaxID=670291 RepID=UPI001AEE48FA
MGDGKGPQHEVASDLSEIRTFRGRLEGLQWVKAISASEYHQDQRAVWLVLLLHQREHQAADFTKGVVGS